MPALLFGSISTIADTSELQRAAFNAAFAQHGLDWNWGVEEYRNLLTSNGGAARIADYAESRGEQVDAAAVHATKSALFQQSLADHAPQPRAGVTQTIAAAHEAGWKLGLVTTTSSDNLDALFAAVAPELERGSFDVIVDSSDVETSKPDPAAYAYALSSLDESADVSVAVEDNVGGVASAQAAGVVCVAFPNENTAGHDFGNADRVDRLEFQRLSATAGAQ
jgi:HAD superfamily hydrolase (TIGR01509 family)